MNCCNSQSSFVFIVECLIRLIIISAQICWPSKCLHYMGSWRSCWLFSVCLVPALSFLATACSKHPFCSILIELPAEGHLLGNHLSVKNPNYSMFVKGRKTALHLNAEWWTNQNADEEIRSLFLVLFCFVLIGRSRIC